MSVQRYDNSSKKKKHYDNSSISDIAILYTHHCYFSLLNMTVGEEEDSVAC